MVPSRVFLTKGVGYHKEKLQSFELALRKAGLEKFNLVRVSSIFPPGARIIPRARGLTVLNPGEIVHVVMSEAQTNEPNRLVAAAVGLAVPAEPNAYGYLSEHHAFGETERKAGDYAEDLAATMLASTLGVEFDPDVNYDERREVYRMSRKIVRSRNITQAARGCKNGRWTTVLACAVLMP